MKSFDLAYVRAYYKKYNEMLFNNSLPNVDEVDFILHPFAYAAGYSRYSDKPTRNGNHHIIAFCRYFVFTDKQIQEILVHEMIHLWQVYHVKEDRYKICSNDIAHDRVFRAKMATINLILKKNWCDIEITEVCTYDLKLDPRNNSKNDFYILVINGDGIVKTHEKNFEKCLNNWKNAKGVESLSYLKTNSYAFSTLPYTVKTNKAISIRSLSKLGLNFDETFKVLLTEVSIDSSPEV